MTTQSTATSLLKAAGAVGILIPQVAAAAIGISFIAYYAGWRDATAYFTTIGSPWAVSMLPTSRLLYLSGELVGLLLLCAFFSIHALATGLVGQKGLSRLSLALFVLAGLSSALARWYPSILGSPIAVWHLSTISGMCFATGSGTTLGEVVSHLKENRLQWTASHAFMIYIAVFVGIYTAPSLIGAARAKYHRESSATTLPAVHLTANNQNESWRLLEVMGESALLIDRETAASLPLFKIVKTNDILSIDATVVDTKLFQ